MDPKDQNDQNQEQIINNGWNKNQPISQRARSVLGLISWPFKTSIFLKMRVEFTVFLITVSIAFIRYFGILTKLVIPNKISLRARLVALVCMTLLGWVLWDKIGMQKETLEGLARINPVSHTQDLIKQKRYAEAYDYLSFFMDYDYVKQNSEAVDLYNEIMNQRNDYYYKYEKIKEGILEGKSDELEGQAAAVISDFLVIGDARDL